MKQLLLSLALLVSTGLSAQIQLGDPNISTTFSVTVTPQSTGTGSVSNTGAGGGISTCSPSGGTCTANYPVGTVVSLTPTLSGGSTFLWNSGTGDMTGCNGGTGTCTFTVTQNDTIIAVFVPSGGNTIPANPFFGIGPNQTVSACTATGYAGQFPTNVTTGTLRYWDSPPLQVPFYYTAVNTWNFTLLDAEACAAARNGVKGILIDFGRTPFFATQAAQFTDTGNCSYLAYTSQTGSTPATGTAITAITETGNVVTVTSTYNPGVGNWVVMYGLQHAGNGYNGAFQVTASSGTSFTYSDPTSALAPGVVSSGTTQLAFAGIPANLTSSAPNQCEPALDLDATPQSGLGNGTDQTYRNLVGAVISHVYQPGYIAGTGSFTFPHSGIDRVEPWNEPDTATFASPVYYTYDQLIRQWQDAKCIINTVTGTVRATGETCLQVRTAVSSAAVNASLFAGLSCTAGTGWPTCPLAPNVKVGAPPGHPQGVALNFAQCFLYCGHPAGTTSSCSCSAGKCNNTAGTPVPCHLGAVGSGTGDVDFINFHDKEGSNYPTELEPQNTTWTANIEGILATAEQALPLYDTEDAYSTCGWPIGGQCPTSNAPPYQYTDNQASFMSRSLIQRWATGWTGLWMYDWTHGNIGPACTSSSDDCAQSGWNTTTGWLAGATLSACTIATTQVTCPITLASGKTGYIMYNYGSAYYCTASTAASCPTTLATPPSGPTTYYDLHGDPGVTLGTCSGCSGRQFPIGIKPTLITN